MINDMSRDSHIERKRKSQYINVLYVPDFWIDLMYVVPRMQSFRLLAVKVWRVDFPSNVLSLITRLPYCE